MAAHLHCINLRLSVKPGSHLCDKHNTSDISTSISIRKKEHVSFFLCLCLCLCRLCYAYRTGVNQALRLIASLYNEGEPPQFSNLHRFEGSAARNPPDIKCINTFRKKAKLYFGRNTENWADYFSRSVNHSIDVEYGRQFAILRSGNF